MSVDFQVVFPQEAVQLSRIQFVQGLVPRTLRVVGKDFSSVDEVLVNQIESPDVIILSKTELLAQVPSQLRIDRISTVSVLSKRLTLTSRSFLRFRIGNTPTKVRGILKLVQLFVKVLFTTPGTDIFSPRLGGAGLRNIGQTFGLDEGGDIVSDFVIAVDNTARQIVAIQSRDPRLPREERLLAARVLGSGFSKQETALYVSVELISQVGRAVAVNMEM
jgi:hypothetical protein